MSNVIENRVVEMQFDNANFEKNVATSMTTLDRLKQSLDFSGSADSLNTVQKAAKELNGVSLNGIADSLAAIQERFSTMGIIGMTIIQDLTSAALGAIANVGRKFFGMITTGGINRAMNIEKAKFQLEGLGIAYKDVFDEIDYAVTNTSFSLDAAAQAAAQLSSAGLDYDEVIFTHQKDQKEITQMGMALRAVSGVAAQTMSDYGMVARYFQDVANAGKVTGATLTYMTQVLNLPVKQDLAEGLKAIADGSYEATEEVKKNAQALVKGTEVSVEDIEKMCQKGYITFDTFSTIMFNKYADHAVEANRTISGVMDNIRSAFAKIGAEFVTPIVQIDGAVVHMLDSFRAKVNEFKGYIIPFAKLTTDSINKVATFIGTSFDKSNLKWVEPFFTGLGGVIKGVTDSLLQVSHAFQNVFPKQLPDKIKEFSEGFKKFGTMFANRRSSISGLEDVHRAFYSFFNLMKSLGNVLKIFTEPFKAFINAFFDSGSNIEISLDTIIASMDKMAEMLNTSENLKKAAENMSKIGHILGQTFRGIVDGIVISIQSLKQGGLKGLVDSVLNNIIRELGDGIIYLAEILTGRNLSEAFTSFNHGVDKMREFFSKFIDACSSGITGIKDFISQLKENLGSFHIDTSGISEFFDGIIEEMSPLDKILQFTTNIFQSFLDFLGSIVPGIINIGKGLVKGFASIIKGIFKALNGENLSEGLNKALGATFLYNLKNVFIQIRKLLNSFGITKGTGPLGAFNNFMQQLQDTFLQFERSFNGSYWLSVAGAILMLAFAMSILAGIDSDKLAEATAVIVSLMAEIGIITKKLSVTDGKLNFADGTSGLIAMTIAVSILAGAMKKIASIEDPNQLIASLISIEILIGTLYAVAKSLSTVGKDKMQMLKGASGLIAMAIAVRILASAMSTIADIPIEKLAGALGSVIVIMALMAEFVKFTQSKDISTGKFYDKTKISTYSDNMISIGIGLMALAGAIKILASAAKDFAELDWEQLGKAGAAITILMAELAAFTKITGDTKRMVAIGVGIIAIAASMKIFASAAKDFGGLDWEQLGKAGAALTAIIAAITLLTKLTAVSGGVTGFFNDQGGFVKSVQQQNLIQLGVGLIAFAAAMKIFASAAEDFGYLDWGDLAKAGAALLGLFTGISLFTHFTDGKNLAVLSGGLLLFSTALLVLAPALKLLASIPFGALLLSLGMVAGLLLTLAVAAKATENVQGSMRSLCATLLLFGAAMAAVGVGLMLLSTGAITAAGAIGSIVLVIKGIIFGIINTIGEGIPLIVETLFRLIDEILNTLEEQIPSIVDSLLNIVIKIFEVLTSRVPEMVSSITTFVMAVVDALGLELGAIDPTSFIAAAVGIAAFISVLGNTARIAQKNILGVALIMAVMAEVALLFLLISSIDATTTLTIAESLSGTMLALSAAMFIISKVPVAAAAQGVAGLAIVIAGIAAILAALGGLNQIPGFSWIIDEGTKVLGQIGTAIGEFFGNIVGGFAEGMASALPKIGASLSQFMLASQPFFIGLKLIDDRVLESALKLAGVILAITAVDVISGLTSWITGGSSFVDFGIQLALFAPYFASFYQFVKDIKPEVVEASANAALALAQMANNLPKEGGWIQKITGEGSLADFAEQLVPFGKAMVKYADSVKDLDVTVVEKSASAGKALTELANTVPNSGGVIAKFVGENNMDTFGQQLCVFGANLAQYSKNVKDVDPTVVEKSVAAGQALSELATNLPNTGGIISWFAGDNDMGKFGNQLVRFGQSLADYSNIVGGENGIKADVIQKSVDAAGALSALANGLPSSGGLGEWLFGGTTDLDTFGNQLVSFGYSMTNFSASLAGVELSNITDVTTGCTALIDLANKLQNIDTKALKDFGKDASSFSESLGKQGTSSIQEFANAFNTSESIIIPAIEYMVDLVLEYIKLKMPEFKRQGEDATISFAEGMKNKIYQVRMAVDQICQEAFKKFSTNINSQKFYTYGQYVSEGFAKGMEDGLDRVRKAADEMVKQAERATTAKAQISSPSKLFRYYGKFLPQGFALGIQDDTDIVSEASESMIDKAYESMSNSILSVFSLIDENIDHTPVISPVLDLTNLRNNAGEINDLFNRSIAVGRINASSAVFSAGNISANGDLQNGKQIGGTTFIQNNYSPKALSRAEIYRQTNNQFARFRQQMG